MTIIKMVFSYLQIPVTLISNKMCLLIFLACYQTFGNNLLTTVLHNKLVAETEKIALELIAHFCMKHLMGSALLLMFQKTKLNVDSN